MNVDVVTGAVETPEEEGDKRYEVQLFREFLLCLPLVCKKKQNKTT